MTTFEKCNQNSQSNDKECSVPGKKFLIKEMLKKKKGIDIHIHIKKLRFNLTFHPHMSMKRVQVQCFPFYNRNLK